MNPQEVEELLNRYDIQSLEELEYYLNKDISSDECKDDKEEKNCTNSQCYEDTFVPDCRKIIEIYIKYFQDDIHKKKDFVEYLQKHTHKSKSSIENYLSCKSCNQQMKKAINHSLKISDYDFKQDFCCNLDKKFNYTTLFGTDYLTVKQFLFKEHEITRDTFKVQIRPKEHTITKEEEKKIFDLTQVSKDKLRENLANPQNTEGSIYYKLNLAQSAFDRNLLKESSKLVDELSKEDVLQTDMAFLQLKAKILSNQQKDKEAIKLLESIIQDSNSSIDKEIYSLLSASIKREAFLEFERYGDEAVLSQKLQKAKDIYFSIYKLTDDYYPLINYMYLELMLLYIHQATSEVFAQKREEFRELWTSLELQVNDWWSYIASIEYLILIGEYTQAKDRLLDTKEELDSLDVTDFSIYSTLRQLELYAHFCPDDALGDIIELLKTFSQE